MSSSISIAPAVVWFRDDLRVSDHPALMRAAESGRPVIGVYVFDERAGGRPLGGAARWWLHGSLRALGAALPASLRAWCVRRCDELAAHLDARRADGYVRACHGDLHLNNVVKRGRDALMFDCIDFDDALRWIDVINDLSFLLMDLHAHDRAALAHRLLNRWLDETGDFAGLAALPLYVAYRALVRALVAT
ncbi:deoxyribodipyrimidine photo-lyase, partial [Burkholderia pseudomallei]|nr:deoxyribodipyrimidine photo-lyase [Burkholderia pseudomallei]